jgi:hypothetical protein
MGSRSSSVLFWMLDNRRTSLSGIELEFPWSMDKKKQEKGKKANKGENDGKKNFIYV